MAGVRGWEVSSQFRLSFLIVLLITVPLDHTDTKLPSDNSDELEGKTGTRPSPPSPRQQDGKPMSGKLRRGASPCWCATGKDATSRKRARGERWGPSSLWCSHGLSPVEGLGPALHKPPFAAPFLQPDRADSSGRGSEEPR